MAVYNVTGMIPVFITISNIDAESEEDAIDQAVDEMNLSGYAGNGGSSKLVGVSGPNVTIEAGELYESETFEIEAHKQE